ncbi:hypothetical protein PEPS_12370 [Persicobacter psychrovividus]|uniref:Uncharacterized protein n=1 Tax=Persicobacter psychrovividus TaxID=387638 RepID=A0ABN6L6V8_9BACT|nr:hypothetical protein PEPS_12370 [Persicobacter psychrovividus]
MVFTRLRLIMSPYSKKKYKKNNIYQKYQYPSHYPIPDFGRCRCWCTKKGVSLYFLIKSLNIKQRDLVAKMVVSPLFLLFNKIKINDCNFYAFILE